MAPAGWRPGWDLAGVIDRAAADGSGPRAGRASWGSCPGPWPQRVRSRPMLRGAAREGDVLPGRDVPGGGPHRARRARQGWAAARCASTRDGATGASAISPSSSRGLAGAHVTASARRADQSAALRQLGAHEVVVGDDIPATPKHDLVIESVGGRTLGTALGALSAAASA